MSDPPESSALSGSDSTAEGERVGLDQRQRVNSSWRPLLAVFLLAVVAQAALHWRSTLYDTDSAVHLAMARLYAQQGVPGNLEIARFSVMHQGFGDKEWLFHALIAPLLLLFEPLIAGRIALALFNGLIAVVLAALARTAWGRWGLLLPFVLPIASTEFFWRTVRLRPELLALPLLLCALVLLADRRPKLLAVSVLLFTWSYTAFHALLGVLLLSWLLLELVEGRLLKKRKGHARAGSTPCARRSPEWKLALYPVLGAGVGLVLHPHFPQNLVVWLVQNVQFFVAKGSLDVGSEIRPNFTDVSLLANLGVWLGLWVLWRSSRPAEDADQVAGRAVFAGDSAVADRLADEKDAAVAGLYARRAVVFGVAATVFGVLYLLMSRFALYAMPLLVLWSMYELRRRGRQPSRWLSLPWTGRVRVQWAVVGLLLVCIPGAVGQLGTYRERTAPGPKGARLAEWHRLSEVIPPGARVAADWRATGVLMLWAPQGRYLNVLDPVFMSTPFPQQHQVLRDILAGSEPDVPSAVKDVLESDYLLVRTIGANPVLLERLANDPRCEVLFQGSYVLVRFRSASGLFVDHGWGGVAGTTTLNRPSSGDGRDLDGYIRGSDFSYQGACMTVETSVPADRDGFVRVDLSPRGQTSVWLDRVAVASQNPGVEAVLGRGLQLALEAGVGDELHMLTIRTCEPQSGGDPGFYLRLAAQPRD